MNHNELKLGQRLMCARKARGLTQQDLSNLTGISQSNIASLESGKTLSTAYDQSLAGVLDIPLNWLLHGTEPDDFLDQAVIVHLKTRRSKAANTGDTLDSDSPLERPTVSALGLETLGKRITYLRERLGYTQVQLAEKAGVSQATIGNLERGRNQTTTKMLSLAEALHTTVEWLERGGDLNLAKRKLVSDALGIKQDQPASFLSQMQRGETLLLKSGEAGSLLPVFTWDEDLLTAADRARSNATGYEWIVCPVSHSPNAFFLRLQLDVMDPEYRLGDLLLVEPGDKEVNSDDVIAIDAKGRVRFGRLRQTFDGRYVEYLNTSYPDRMHRVEASDKVVGVVALSIRIRAKQARV